jgi:hypothetical protein
MLSFFDSLLNKSWVSLLVFHTTVYRKISFFVLITAHLLPFNPTYKDLFLTLDMSPRWETKEGGILRNYRRIEEIRRNPQKHPIKYPKQKPPLGLKSVLQTRDAAYNLC